MKQRFVILGWNIIGFVGFTLMLIGLAIAIPLENERYYLLRIPAIGAALFGISTLKLRRFMPDWTPELVKRRLAPLYVAFWFGLSAILFLISWVTIV